MRDCEVVLHELAEYARLDEKPELIALKKTDKVDTAKQQKWQWHWVRGGKKHARLLCGTTQR